MRLVRIVWDDYLYPDRLYTICTVVKTSELPTTYFGHYVMK